MMVAQVRGLKFHYDALSGEWDPVSTFQALEVLEEVAEALGYPNATKYNDACLFRPASVERRLKALK